MAGVGHAIFQDAIDPDKPDSKAVTLSCFAPPVVKPGTSFDLTVSAGPKRATNAFWGEAISGGAAKAGAAESMSIAKGTPVTVELVRKMLVVTGVVHHVP